MANQARFKIVQDGSSPGYGIARRDILAAYPTGSITFEAEQPGLVYSWEVVQPPGSSVTIGGSTQQIATFDAMLDGGYIVKLTVNPGTADEDVDLLYFGIATDINGTGCCLPALNETTQDNSLGHPEWGWWEKLYTFLRELASLAGTGGGDTFFEVGETGTDSLQRKDFGTAYGDYSWALGSGSEASGDAAWSIGSRSIASGDGAIAFGNSSEAVGDASFAFGTSVITKDGSTVFGLGYENSFPHALAVGVHTAVMSAFTNPQALRIPVNGRTQSVGTVGHLHIDSNGMIEIGPVPACSYMNIALHLVAKSDSAYDTSPALVTFDGEIQAISSSTGITYQDWSISKTSSTSVFLPRALISQSLRLTLRRMAFVVDQM
jgi:hypothetical protein